MICKQCNNTVPNDSEYCPFCGNIVEKSITEANSVSDVDKGYTYLELGEWKKAKEIFDFAIVNNDNKAKAYIGRLLAKLKLSDLESLSAINKKLTKFDDYKNALKYADDNYKILLKKYYSLVEQKIIQKKIKAKKWVLISAISCVSAVAVFALSYFVFIPLGRCSYYENLLAGGEIEKATNAFSYSDWFEFDEKAKGIFYNKGISLAEQKDYKNAEHCFEVTDGFADTENYYNYCKAQNLLAKKDLESYNYFTECKDFLDSKNILETNEYFILVNKLQGEWYYPGQSKEERMKEMRESGDYYEVDGNFYIKEYYDSYDDLLATIEEKGSIHVPGGLLSSGSSVRAETLRINGAKHLKIVRNGVIGYNQYASYVPIEFIDDTHIKLSNRLYSKK
ncbi:MAG: hypothetical protein IKD04_06505 [Clostridia bacterium]|nr:hypothetical protein [Clostridia bacterium]